jgi:hypothetical protein
MPLFNNLGVGRASSILGGIAAGLSCVPFVFYSMSSFYSACFSRLFAPTSRPVSPSPTPAIFLPSPLLSDSRLVLPPAPLLSKKRSADSPSPSHRVRPEAEGDEQVCEERLRGVTVGEGGGGVLRCETVFRDVHRADGADLAVRRESRCVPFSLFSSFSFSAFPSSAQFSRPPCETLSTRKLERLGTSLHTTLVLISRPYRLSVLRHSSSSPSPSSP